MKSDDKLGLLLNMLSECFVEFLGYKRIDSLGIVKIDMMPSMGHNDYARILVPCSMQILDSFITTLWVHPIVRAVNKGHWYIDGRDTVDQW